jgi:ATP phosphoribosyltransferase regulatory subunit
MDMTLSYNEKAIFSLRELYSKYGYSQYKMSKFEEYDLYAKNKDFLISDRVITFTDLGGKLLALKPDVTLSIIKNSVDKPDIVQKVYYNENVYRVAKGSLGFKEIMQVGLECFGNIDIYNISEVICLAVKSLEKISDDCVLDISHLGILSSLLDYVGVAPFSRGEVIKCIGEKNTHELEKVCAGAEPQKLAILKSVVNLSGKAASVFPKLKELLKEVPCAGILSLEELICALPGRILEKINIDFSVVDDVNYYNGIVFKGFINGIPSSVIAGGQYDNLMRKMNRKSGAIGFAVYLDLLETLDKTGKEYDVDILLIYDNESAKTVSDAVSSLIDAGNSVLAQRKIPDNIKYKTILKLSNGEVETLENNA